MDLPWVDATDYIPGNKLTVVAHLDSVTTLLLKKYGVGLMVSTRMHITIDNAAPHVCTHHVMYSSMCVMPSGHVGLYQ